MLQRIPLHAQSCQLKLGVLTLPIGDNQAELNATIRDHYIGEAQTLTSGAEENLLKLGEITDSLGAEELIRWEQIKADFARIRSMGGEDASAMTQIAYQIVGLSDGLGSIEKSINQAFTKSSIEPVQQTLQEMVSLIKTMELNVEVVNKPVPGMDKVLSAMGDAINNSLLPVVQSMEYKLKMDHDIWERVKRLGDQINSLEKSMLKTYQTQHRLTKKPVANRKD